MKRKLIRLTAIAAALTLSSCIVSCGNEVPSDKQDNISFTVEGGTTAGGEAVETSAAETIVAGNNENTSAAPAQTTPAVTDSLSSILTRSPEELDAIRNKPTTAAPSEGGDTSNGGNAGTPEAPSGITLSYYEAEVIAGQTLKYPTVSENITEVWTSSDTSVATVDSAGNITGVGEGSCIIRVVSKDNSSLGAEVKVTVSANTGTQVNDGLTYINGMLIANKSYSLPSTYDPGGLTSDTVSAFYELAAGAAQDGYNIYISSGYRSYWTQDYIYNNYVAQSGQATADTFSARPGYSEHQTGLAIDVNEISDAFIGTPEAIWLENHCQEYGFIIRYPKGKQSITGYKYEPWHIRYIGKENAAALKEAAAAAGDPYLTMEEWLGIDSYYH